MTDFIDLVAKVILINVAFLLLVVTSPIWLPIWLLGKLIVYIFTSNKD